MFNRSAFNQARWTSPAFGKPLLRPIYGAGSGFNQANFNRLPFNARNQVAWLGFPGVGGLDVKAVAVIRGAASLSGEGGLSVLIITFGSAHLSGTGGLDTQGVRVQISGADLSGVGTLAISGTQVGIEEIELLGDFKPGDVLEIDMEQFTVKLNGQYVMEQVNGEYFDLLRGANELIYRDSSGSREVRVKITHKPRWM